MDLKRNVGGKMLRCGYTTGSCAAAGTRAALMMLLSGQEVRSVTLDTPAGVLVPIDILDITMFPEKIRCAVRKDSGDDPDATRDMLIYTELSLIPEGIELHAGEGVGHVTRPGLDQPVGNAAINSTPRRMIAENVREISEKYGYTGGVSITFSIPGGEEVARKTFNPRMGVEGGLSIIGTSGIVEPMSNKALVGTIQTLIRQCAATGAKEILLTPGNYGEAFTTESLGLSLDRHVSCSNFIGDAIDCCVEEGFQKILLIGHIGKLVKLGMGVTNTHSSNGDGRIEELITCGLEAGASLDALREIAGCVTTDAALAVLEEEGLLREAMDILGERIQATLERRIPSGIEIGFICFTKDERLKGVLCESRSSHDIRKNFLQDKKTEE